MKLGISGARLRGPVSVRLVGMAVALGFDAELWGDVMALDWIRRMAAASTMGG